MTDPQIGEAARQFSVLSEPSRLMLLRELMEGEAAVGDLAEKTGLKQGVVSKHLGILTDSGFLGRRREGTFVFYQICDPLVFKLCELMCCRISEAAARKARELT